MVYVVPSEMLLGDYEISYMREINSLCFKFDFFNVVFNVFLSYPSVTECDAKSVRNKTKYT